jgi:hypothetical protein
MPNMIETLQQDEWWYGRDSFPYRLDEMDAAHLWNVYNFLARRATQLRTQHYWAEFLEHHDIADEEVGPYTRAAFREWLRRQNEIDGLPLDWLRATPLARELKHQIALRTLTEGVVVNVQYERELESVSGTDGRAVGADPGLRDRPALG